MTEGREDKRKGRREEHNALKRKIISISITRRLLNLAVAVTAACGERQREREQRGGWSEGDRDTLVQSGRGPPAASHIQRQYQFGQRIISEKNLFRRKRFSSHETPRGERTGKKDGREGGRESQENRQSEIEPRARASP